MILILIETSWEKNYAFIELTRPKYKMQDGFGLYF